MSTTTKELETQLREIKNQINNRKNDANDLKLAGKVSDVARTYGTSDMQGFFFSEKGLSINFESSYIKVSLGHGTEDVFQANLLQNSVGEIHLYISGDWEKRIEELHSKISEIRLKRKNSSIQNEIDKLKKKWRLGEGS